MYNIQLKLQLGKVKNIRKDKKYNNNNIFIYNNKINFKYHLTELKDRVNITGISFISSLVLCLFYSKEIIKIIQLIGLKKNVSFLQLSPGDFFFTSIDVFIIYFKDRFVFWDIMRDTFDIISNNIIRHPRTYHSRKKFFYFDYYFFYSTIFVRVFKIVIQNCFFF